MNIDELVVGQHYKMPGTGRTVELLATSVICGLEHCWVKDGNTTFVVFSKELGLMPESKAEAAKRYTEDLLAIFYEYTEPVTVETVTAIFDKFLKEVHGGKISWCYETKEDQK